MKTTHSPFKKFAAVFLGLLVVVFGLVAFVAFRPAALIEHVKSRALPKISDRLGREVTVGEIDARIFPKPHAVISDFQIAGAPGEPAFVKAPSAEMSVELWPLVFSFGKDIRVSGFALQDAELALVRRKDGTWSYEDLTRKWKEGAPASAEPTPDRAVRVAELSVTNGRVRVIDQGGVTGDDGVALDQIDLTSRDLTLDGPVRFDVLAAFASSKQNVKGSLDFDRLPSGFDESNPATWPKLKGELSVTGASLPRLRDLLPAKLAELTTGGLVDTRLTLTTREDHRYQVNGFSDLRALRVRGQPADGKFAFKTTIDPGSEQTGRIDVQDLALNGPGLDLTGNAWVQLEPMRGEFALEGQYLDLDTLLGVMPAKEEAAAGANALPAAVRQRIAATKLNGTLELARVTRGKLEATALSARAELSNGVLTLQNGTAKVYGGVARLDGTRVDLTRDEPSWTLEAGLEGLDVGSALQQFQGGQPLQGKASGVISLQGQGADWTKIRRALTGRGSIAFDEGKLTGTDLGEKLAGPLSTALSKVGRAGLGGKAGTVLEKGTSLKDLSAVFSVKDGFLALSKPLRFDSQTGTASLGGRIGLDLSLDLDGEIAVKPAFIAQVAGSQWAPGSAVTVPLGIGGSLKAPTVQPPQPEAFAKALLNPKAAPPVVKEKVEDVKNEVKRQARKRLEGIFRRP